MEFCMTLEPLLIEMSRPIKRMDDVYLVVMPPDPFFQMVAKVRVLDPDMGEYSTVDSRKMIVTPVSREDVYHLDNDNLGIMKARTVRFEWVYKLKEKRPVIKAIFEGIE
jgi:hypothetical protein